MEDDLAVRFWPFLRCRYARKLRRREKSLGLLENGLRRCFCGCFNGIALLIPRSGDSVLEKGLHRFLCGDCSKGGVAILLPRSGDGASGDLKMVGKIDGKICRRI